MLKTMRICSDSLIALALGIFFSLNAWSYGTALAPEVYRKLAEDAQIHFENFTSTRRWNGQHSPPILDTRFKYMFRGQLRKAAAAPPNFDGKYVVAIWGCGTMCQQFAIINLETGRVKANPNQSAMLGLKFRLNSSLLIINDPEEVVSIFGNRGELIPNYMFSQYLKWDGKNLIRMRSINL